MRKTNEGAFGWSMPPGSAFSDPADQDEYIFDVGGDLLYDILINQGYSNSSADMIVDKILNNDSEKYEEWITKNQVVDIIKWDDATDNPIFSPEYKELQKKADKIFKNDRDKYKKEKSYIKKELLKKTLEKIANSDEFQEWIDNFILSESANTNIMRFVEFLKNH